MTQSQSRDKKNLTNILYSTTADLKTAKEDKIIVGAKHGYATMNRKTGEIEYIKRIWNERDGPGKEERFASVSLTL